MNWICQFCGGDTSEVEYEYLDAHNHLSCTLEYLNNTKVKTKLKIENPNHINTKNYQLDGSIVEISYIGIEDRINASDKKPYMVYRFEGVKNNTFSSIVQFDIHTKIRDNKVQFNIWKNGGMEFSSLTIGIIKNRDELIARLINEVNKY